MKEQDKLRKKVNELIKKQKLSAVRKILQSHDYTKPWTADARAKVCLCFAAKLLRKLGKLMLAA